MGYSRLYERNTQQSGSSCAYDLGARSPSRSCATLVGVYSHMLLLRAGGPVRTPPPAPTGSTRRVRAPCPGNHASVDDLALVALLVAKCGILSLILSFRFRLHTGSLSYVVRLWLGVSRTRWFSVAGLCLSMHTP